MKRSDLVLIINEKLKEMSIHGPPIYVTSPDFADHLLAFMEDIGMKPPFSYDHDEYEQKSDEEN